MPSSENAKCRKRSRKIIIVVSLALMSVLMTNFSTAQGYINDPAHFPDTNFLSFVESYMGGDFTAADAAAKTGVLNCHGLGISDLTGIEYFTGIRGLVCRNNQITSLHISHNTDLVTLNCDSNQLTSLDISNNTVLINLHCESNQLTSLDVTNNTALYKLYCSDNQLTNLDVTKNTALTQFHCWRNQLTNLDVTNNTDLTQFLCWSNQLTNLDVTKNTALTQFHCWNNQLSSLNVTSNIALTQLDCGENQLTSLDVSHNTALTLIYCDRNQLTSLDVTNNTALIQLRCNSNQLTSLDVSHNTALTLIYCYENPLTSLDVSSNTALIHLNCKSNQLTSLDVTNNTALAQLNCDNNQLTNIFSLIANTGLGSGDYVDVRYNNLSCDDWAAILVLQNRIGIGLFIYYPQNTLMPYDCASIDTSYLVNGDGFGRRYWPGKINGSYFDAQFIPATALGGEETYPAWCADMLTKIQLGVWYNNIGIYTSETDVCSLVGNPENFKLVNYLLVNYRYGSYIGVHRNVIQAVIWKLLFNGEAPDIGGDGISSGGYISWDNSLASSIYSTVLMTPSEDLPDYANNTFLPITIIIDSGDQVNLLEIPYWMYVEFVDLGIVGDCQ